TANFAISNPAREVLFTVLRRDEKYKAKNVIDTLGARGADAAGGWLITGLRACSRSDRHRGSGLPPFGRPRPRAGAPRYSRRRGKTLRGGCGHGHVGV